MFPEIENHAAAVQSNGNLAFTYLDSLSQATTENSPATDADGIVSLVSARMQRFADAPPGARESDHSRRDRKYIAAHPDATLRAAYRKMNAAQRMEFEMMMDKHSHSGLSSPLWARQHAQPQRQVVGDDGKALAATAPRKHPASFGAPADSY